jgi:hypothetical protein
VPADVTLPAAGGTVRFVVDDALSHTLVSGGFPEQRLGGLGQPRQVELEFRAAGAVSFTDRRNRPLAPQEAPGSVTVAAAPSTSPPPAAQPQAPQQVQPAPARTSPAARAPSSPRATTTPLRPTADAVAAPQPALPSPPPSRPPPTRDAADVDDTDETPSFAAAALPPVQAVPGPLPGEPTSRPLGLPAALAALAVLGVASLIVRVLLAEPVDEDR